LAQALELLVSETKGAVSQEFDLMLRELRMGVSFDVAVLNLHRRIPVTETQLVAASMRIARETGGNLAEVIERLAETLRRKIEMEGKIRALTAQGKAQGWVMALLPLFLAYVLSLMEPEHMARLFSEPIGWGVCTLVIVMEFIGYKFIKKIVSIDV
jgi:tight adherence protein B